MTCVKHAACQRSPSPQLSSTAVSEGQGFSINSKRGGADSGSHDLQLASQEVSQENTMITVVLFFCFFKKAQPRKSLQNSREAGVLHLGEVRSNTMTSDPFWEFRRVFNKVTAAGKFKSTERTSGHTCSWLFREAIHSKAKWKSETQKPDSLKAPHCLYHISSLALVIHTVLVYSGGFLFLT